MGKLAERTIPYKTWLKTSIVEALRPVFADHPDPDLARTKVSIEYPHDESSYPAVIVRFYERGIRNAGIGHEEHIQVGPSLYRFKHYIYTGDIEFAIFALSSLDRDLIADSIVQTLTMGDLAAYTRPFYKRIFEPSGNEYVEADYNFININTDQVTGYGESQTPAPWLAEDTLVYQTSYRCGLMGEFYSLPPVTSDALTYIEDVIQYPYIGGLEEVPEGSQDPAEWIPPIDDLQQPG